MESFVDVKKVYVKQPLKKSTKSKENIHNFTLS